MINTTTVKPRGGRVFTIGPDDAARRILMVGSCRSVPYLNYLNRFLTMNPGSMRVQFIDPNDWHWDEAGSAVDFEAALQAQESNPHVLRAIGEATVYLHEWYESYGMFNCSPDAEKNIFQFGMNPEINVCVPNFHDHFILFNEQIMFNSENAWHYAMASRGAMTDSILSGMRGYGLRAVEKFLSVCLKSDIPELADHFRQNWTNRRFFWTGNHVSKHFTTYVFERINEKFLHLPLNEAFWGPAGEEDLFKFPNTAVTQFDVDAYGLTWPDTPIEPLKL